MGNYHSVTTSINDEVVTVEKARKWLNRTGRLILERRPSLFDWQASLYVEDFLELRSYGDNEDLAILALFDHIVTRMLVEIERIEKSKS